MWRTPVAFDASIDEAMMQEIQSLPCGNERRLGLILQLGKRNAAKRMLQWMFELRLHGDADELRDYTAYSTQ